MKSFLIALMILASCSPSEAEVITRDRLGYPVRAIDIHDGDTFTIDAEQWSPFPNLRWKVRIRGIDTPEMRSRCVAERVLARRAKDYLVSMFTTSEKAVMRAAFENLNNDPNRTALRKRVAGYSVWLSAVDHDKYGGRFDALVTLADGSSAGDRLIEAGLARPYFGERKKPWCDQKGNIQ